jgi:hypothetical protein
MPDHVFKLYEQFPGFCNSNGTNGTAGSIVGKEYLTSDAVRKYILLPVSFLQVSQFRIIYSEKQSN